MNDKFNELNNKIGKSIDTLLNNGFIAHHHNWTPTHKGDGDDATCVLEFSTKYGQMYVEEHLKALCQFLCDYLETDKYWFRYSTSIDEYNVFNAEILIRLKTKLGSKTNMCP